jgi:hypothetical protein
VERDKETIKRMFPNLAKEIESGESKVSVNSVRTDNGGDEKNDTRKKYSEYVPDIIDFLRRCDTVQQAEEIIAYMEKRGEIHDRYARQLRKQLKEKGVRSFGTKKEDGYYLKHGDVSS